MKTLIIILFTSTLSYAQVYEYAHIYEVTSGMVQTKAEFSFGMKYDSAKAYGKYKQSIDALDYASKKGWELYQVYSQQSTAQITVYLLRRRKQVTNQ